MATEHPNQFPGAQKLAAHVHLLRDLLQTPDLHRNPPAAPWTSQSPPKATSSCSHQSSGCQGTRAPPPQGPFSEGGSEPSPPRPAGTSGSYPPTASQSRSRPSRTFRSRTVAHSTHLRHPLEASGGRIIPPLGGPPTFLRLSGQGHRGRLAGRHNPGQKWRGKGLLRDPFPPEKIAGGSREVTSPPHTGAVNPSRR